MWPREFFAGVAARVFNDTAAAHASFTAARAIAEKIVRDNPDKAYAWSLLGLIDAGLGRKEEAVREGRRACELVPMSKKLTAIRRSFRLTATSSVSHGESTEIKSKIVLGTPVLKRFL